MLGILIKPVQAIFRHYFLFHAQVMPMPEWFFLNPYHPPGSLPIPSVGKMITMKNRMFDRDVVFPSMIGVVATQSFSHDHQGHPATPAPNLQHRHHQWADLLHRSVHPIHIEQPASSPFVRLDLQYPKSGGQPEPVHYPTEPIFHLIAPMVHSERLKRQIQLLKDGCHLMIIPSDNLPAN